MNKVQQFDMISRTAGEQLPGCDFSPYYDETIDGYKIEFHGTDEELSKIPVLLDFIIDDCILVSSAQLKNIHKNGGDYIAVYHAYALHIFDDVIPL